MKTTIADSIKRVTIIILFLSILLLMLNSFLPMVKVDNISTSNETVFLNLISMRYISDNELLMYYNYINIANTYLWLIIIVMFLSFFALLLKLSEKFKLIGILFLSIGCGSIIFCCISCYYYFNFILGVINSGNISLAEIINQLKFPYVNFIPLILLVIACIAYISIVIPYLINLFKSKKGNFNEKTQDERKTIETVSTKTFRTNENVNIRKYDLEEEFKKKKQTFDENNVKEKLVSKTEYEEPFQRKIEPEKEVEQTSPFNIQSTKEHISAIEMTSEEVKLSETFKKALYSAIDKKKRKEWRNQTEDEEKSINKVLQKPKKVKKEDSKTKKFNVKCPDCNYIFTAIKQTESLAKIKCPRCGKEGVIK